jgi:hypothetical protein
VHAEAALADDSLDLAEALLPGVLRFERASGFEAAVVDREHQRFEQRPVRRVEWAVQEYAPIVAAAADDRQRPRPRFFRCFF